jgi:hypothetical protein
MSAQDHSPVPVEHIDRSILVIRGQRVILDEDLAVLYGVKAKRLNEQVKRNQDRFPQDFAFQLAAEEWVRLRSQFATLKTGRGAHRKYLPWAFTEHGAIMAATVLNSPLAVQISLHVVRAFVRMRSLLQSQEDIWRKITALEKKYDRQFRSVFDAIRELMEPPPEARRTIGFVPPTAPGKQHKARR